MQDLLTAWGEEIARLLAERAMSQGELARRCGVEPSTISRIVRGLVNPTDELKWKIAGALGERMDVVWAWPRIVPPTPERVGVGVLTTPSKATTPSADTRGAVSTPAAG